MPHRVFSILLLALTLCACKHQSEAKPPIERYKLEGTVVQLFPQQHTVKVDGQEIKGWMEAMTMEYEVKDPTEFAALQTGERITATVFVQGLSYWLGEIHQAR